MNARSLCGWLMVLVALALVRPSRAEPGGLVPPGLPAGDVAALATSNGHLYVGLFDRGVVEVPLQGRNDGAVSSLGSQKAQVLNPNVNALLADRAQVRLWVGTARGLFVCTAREPAECRRVGENKSVHALVELRDGTVVAGGDGGLLLIPAAGPPRVFARKQGAPFRAVWALAEAADGTLFVGTTSGVYFGQIQAFTASSASASSPSASVRRPGVRLRRAAVVTGDLGDDWVTALAIASDVVHVGTYNAGVSSFRLSAGRLERVGADPTLGYVNPNGIAPLPNGTLAVATMVGLRVGKQGSWHTIPTLHKDVTAVVPAGAGEYWVASRRGVQKLRLVDAEAAR